MTSTGGKPGVGTEIEFDDGNDDVSEDIGNDNTARPPGDWTVAPDPVEPNKEGQEIEDPREARAL